MAAFFPWRLEARGNTGQADLNIKKLGFTNDEFQAYLQTPPVPHSKYALSISLFDEIPALKPFKKLLGK